MASSETIKEIFGWLKAHWPKEPYTKDTMTVYKRCLKDLDDDLLKAATVHCISTRTFWPRVKELRDAAFDILCNRVGLLTSGEAWTLVLKYSHLPATWSVEGRRCKRPELPELVDRTLKSIGGWGRLSNSDNYAADRAKFRDNYNDFIEKGRDMVQMLPEVRELAKALAMDRKALEG